MNRKSIGSILFPLSLAVAFAACGKDDTNSAQQPGSSAGLQAHTAAASADAFANTAETVKLIGLADIYEPQLHSQKSKDASGYNFQSDGGCHLADVFLNTMQDDGSIVFDSKMKKHCDASKLSHEVCALKQSIKNYCQVKGITYTEAANLAQEIHGVAKRLDDRCMLQKNRSLKGDQMGSGILLISKSIMLRKLLHVSNPTVAERKKEDKKAKKHK